MGKRRLSPEDQERLRQNENVLRASGSTISYDPEFKIAAVRANLAGKAPTQIFQEAGFDLDAIGRRIPRRCLERWRRDYRQRGEEGLGEDRRGKHSTGRPSNRELTVKEKLRRAELRVLYLERENELLKKLDRLERSVVNKPARKYALIHRLNSADRKGFPISYLCDVAGVSRSGYYRWLRSAPKRKQRDQADEADYKRIQEIFLKKNRKAGWRVIKMNLERQSFNMNHKKIRRLMQKHELVAQIRRKNPYRNIGKANLEHQTLPNVLNRNFAPKRPYQAFGTDITYLRDGSGHLFYLSVLRDMASAEIVAHCVSTSLDFRLSIGLIRQAESVLGERLEGALIHSDQGLHYTHPSYVKYLAELGVVQSMSRKGNCLDNAPTESFFGHMKDELDLSGSRTITEVIAAIDLHLYDYNHYRYQWTRKKMAPVEYRNHLLAA